MPQKSTSKTASKSKDKEKEKPKSPAAPAKKSPAAATKDLPPPPPPESIGFTSDDGQEFHEMEAEAFVERQRKRLLELRDHFVDQMQGVAQDNLRTRAEGSEGSAFGQHQADAGSDAYEKDFALSLLSQEQDALYEIEEALKRIENGTYGVCEMSSKKIPQPRLEAMPFARFTIDCQVQLEKENRGRRRWETGPQFMDSADAFNDEEEESSDDEDRKRDRDKE